MAAAVEISEAVVAVVVVIGITTSTHRIEIEIEAVVRSPVRPFHHHLLQHRSTTMPPHLHLLSPLLPTLSTVPLPPPLVDRDQFLQSLQEVSNDGTARRRFLMIIIISSSRGSSTPVPPIGEVHHRRFTSAAAALETHRWRLVDTTELLPVALVRWFARRITSAPATHSTEWTHRRCSSSSSCRRRGPRIIRRKVLDTLCVPFLRCEEVLLGLLLLLIGVLEEFPRGAVVSLLPPLPDAIISQSCLLQSQLHLQLNIIIASCHHRRTTAATATTTTKAAFPRPRRSPMSRFALWSRTTRWWWSLVREEEAAEVVQPEGSGR